MHVVPTRLSYSQTVDGIKADEGGETYLWNLLLIVVPILVMSAMGIVAIAVVFGWTSYKLRELGWTYVKGHARILCFVVYFVSVYVFVFSFQIELISQRNDQYEAYNTYMNCLYQALFNPTLDCQLDTLVSFPLWVLVVLAVSGQGL